MLVGKAKIIKLGNDNGAWSVIVLTRTQVAQLNPTSRSSFRVKGKLDEFPIKFKSLLPLGDGRFMLMINAEMRKGTGKKAGDTLRLAIEPDMSSKRLSTEFLTCLKDVPAAYEFFQTLNTSNQHYFDFWIRSAKTADTKAERLSMSISALSSRKKYSEMRRSFKRE